MTNRRVRYFIMGAAAIALVAAALIGLARWRARSQPLAERTVVRITPPDGTADVALDTPVTIAFDQPIVLTDTLSADARDPQAGVRLPQPLDLFDGAAPGAALAGTGRWLAPTLYSFYPADGLHAATTYTVTLRRDRFPGGPALIHGPSSWRFTTRSQLLASTRPFDGATEVAVDGPIEVYLGPDVDPASAGAHFRLQDVEAEQTVAGAVRPAENGFAFTPGAPLAMGATYEAQLLPGITTVRGGQLQYQPPAWRFTTIRRLAVARVGPTDRATDVPPDARISVTFNRPVVALPPDDDQSNLPQPLTIEPPVPGAGRWFAPDTYIYSPTTALDPDTSYAVQVAAGLQDADGNALRQPLEWNFHTLAFRVIDMPSGTIDPPSTLQARFSLPVNLGTLRDALHVYNLGIGAEVPGTIAIEGPQAIFTPLAPLERGARYAFTIGPSVRSAGGAPLGRLYSQTFAVVGAPEIVSTTPRNDAQNVTPGRVASGGTPIELDFNVPMDWDSILQNLRIDPPTRVVTMTGDRLDLDLLPQTWYTITVGAASRDRYGMALGRDTTFSFRTGSPPSSLELATSLLPNFEPSEPEFQRAPKFKPARLSFSDGYTIGTYSAYDPARIALRSTNVPGIGYQIYRLEPTQVISLATGDSKGWEQFHPDPALRLKGGTLSLDGVPDRQSLSVLDIGRLAPGLYHLLVYGPAPTFDYQMMAVSRFALTIKRSADQLFVWAVDLSSGAPVPDLPLNVSFRQGTPVPGSSSASCAAAVVKTRALGRTDGDGVLQTALTPVQLDALPDCPIFVWSAEGDRFAFASSTWNRDISVASFGMPAGHSPSRVVGNVYTERPLYRPGQMVFIRGMVRIDQDRVYQLPSAGRQVRLTINDARGATVLSTLLPINQTGSFSATLPLERSAVLGTYGIFVRLEGERAPENGSASVYHYSGTPFPAYHFFNSFTVAEYRKPSFKVAVSPDRSSLLPNSTAVFTISASYFSGEPVVDGRVRWYVVEAPLDFASETAGDFRFGKDAEPAQALFGTRSAAVNTGTTDRQGQLVVQSNISLFGDSQRLALYAEVTDAASQVSYGQALNNVHAGSFYLGLRPAKIVARVGEAQSIDVVALDPSDRPVANRAIRVTIAKRNWFSSSEQGSEGRFYWSSTYEDTVLTTSDVSTGAGGRASVAFTPAEGGAYRLSAEAVDGAGNQVSSSMLTYVFGGDLFWGVDNTNQIKLIADRASYRPGDVATILIPAPYAGMTALMTIERGQVIEHHTLVITGTTGLFSVPIVADYTPNIYVSAVLVKPSGADMPVPELRADTISLAVPFEQQILKVDITPNKPRAGPGERVTFDIKVSDSNGKGVRAELALALVDQSLLELVKTLSKNPTPTYTNGFFSRRPLGVETSNTLVQLVDRVTLRIQPGSKGGGGGGPTAGVIPGSTGILDDLLLRRDFPDTAYWNPALMTDDDGHVSVAVTLPDNLTTWRMVARALTSDTRFGQATRDVVVSRDLFVEPILPAALIVGDRVAIRAVVHYPGGAAPLDVTVRLETEGLQLGDPAEQTVQVPAGGQGAIVTWQATAAAAARALLQFSVRGGGLQDRVEQLLPISRYAPPDVVAGAGQIQDVATATLSLPNAPDAATGRELIVDLAPSLAAAIETAADALDRIADASTEQTVSSFLRRLIADRAPQLAGAARTSEEVERDLSPRLQRLYRLQNLDGGWGWWSQDGMSQPYLSAYVLQGLIEARKSGHSVDSQVFDRAVTYLQTSLNDFALDASDSAPWRRNTRSYVLFVLAEAGKTDVSRTVALYDQRDRLGTYGRAYLLMTLVDLGGEEQRVRVLLNELVSSAVPRADGVYWTEPSADLETMSSTTRTTALALQALVRADPTNLLIPYALRGLMSQRAGGGWHSSQESALALVALAEYMAQSDVGAAKYGYRVELGNQTLLAGTVDADNYTRPISAAVELPGADVQLTLHRETGWFGGGRGDLFYQLRVRSYQDVVTVVPLDHGLRIERSYLSVDQNTLESGNQELREARLGELVLVQLKLTVPLAARFLAIEDTLPAGLEPLDIVPRSAGDFGQTLQPGQSAPAMDGQFFNNVEIHRNRVALFATSISSGTYYYSYLVRATTPGVFQAPPASAYQMYAPNVTGTSAGGQFTVREPE